MDDKAVSFVRIYKIATEDAGGRSLFLYVRIKHKGDLKTP